MTEANKKMKVLVACEYSGTVRDAFINAGHDAISCDLLPTDVPGPHYHGSVFDLIDENNTKGWDLMIGHPPCTYLTLTGNKWFKPEFADRFPNRHRQREEAVEFFRKLFECSIPKVCLENPVGVLSTMYMKATQYIHPYHFGDPHSKKTGLWLKNLPPLVSTKMVEPQFHIYKDGRRDPIWHYESMRMKPLERMKYRSKTFQGIADAMAKQWGSI
jgi:site-specific DNA-cytosine methylase